MFVEIPLFKCCRHIALSLKRFLLIVNTYKLCGKRISCPLDMSSEGFKQETLIVNFGKFS